MRSLLILSAIFIFCTQNVYASDAYGKFSAARQATFSGGSTELMGSGTITEGKQQKPYNITAKMRNMEETRLRINMENESIALILTHGKIYDENWDEQKVSNLFAKLVSLGILDIFLLIEILDGERDELYRPYMNSTAKDSITLSLSPDESKVLYEHWTSDLRGLLGAAAEEMSERELALAESVMRQILSALEANVLYTFHLHPETSAITQIDIQTETAAPRARLSQSKIEVSSLSR